MSAADSSKLLKKPFWNQTWVRLSIILLAVVGVFGLVAYFNTAPNQNSAANNSSNSMSNPQTLENGLVIDDTKVGSGEEIMPGDFVTMHYTGRLEDGTVFDSSVERNQPFEFQVGVGQVIQGWEQGVPGMRVGGKRTLTIPADLAYGQQGVPGAIPGGATLIFDIEALEVNSPN